MLFRRAKRDAFDFDRARDGLFSDRRQRKRHSMVQEESTYVGISTISTGSHNFGIEEENDATERRLDRDREDMNGGARGTQHKREKRFT